MNKPDDARGIKISALAKAAGVSVSRIHYYVQQGLLTPPAKTSRNMAYYDPRSSAEIRLIQELQSRRYLPLAVIKMIMQAKREGQDIRHVAEMQSIMTDIYRPVDDTGQPRSFDGAGLAAAAGLPESSLQALVNMGLIKPVASPGGPLYDDIDLRIARMVVRLTGFGLQIDDLRIYRGYVEFAAREAQALHAAFHRLPDHETVPLTELFKTVAEFKGYLALKILRQAGQEFGSHHRKPLP
jgi:DNA-binding transcriptional MerR regulator